MNELNTLQMQEITSNQGCPHKNGDAPFCQINGNVKNLIVQKTVGSIHNEKPLINQCCEDDTEKS